MKQICDGEKLNRMFVRLAHEVIERNDGMENVVLLGIQRSGVAVAERLRRELARIEGVCPPTGALDITLYRDDLLRGGKMEQNLTLIDFSVDGKCVVLCDDVFQTGRTVRAAISAVLALGRPSRIQFLVIADRGRRQLPFAADYAGKNVSAEEDEKVFVRLPVPDGDETAGIWIEEKNKII